MADRLRRAARALSLPVVPAVLLLGGTEFADIAVIVVMVAVCLGGGYVIGRPHVVAGLAPAGAIVCAFGLGLAVYLGWELTGEEARPMSTLPMFAFLLGLLGWGASFLGAADRARHPPTKAAPGPNTERAALAAVIAGCVASMALGLVSDSWFITFTAGLVLVSAAVGLRDLRRRGTDRHTPTDGRERHPMPEPRA